MSDRTVLLFNPTQAKPGELEATLVARRPLFEELEAALRADADGPSVRHWLIVAPRGSGKSHLVEMLARRMRDDWSVVRLPEEAYRVRSVADLLAWIVGALEGMERPFADVADRARVEVLAEERIRRWRRERGPVLVILENLAEILERRFDRREQARLRALLMGDPPFLLVATSVRMTGAVRDHGAPFYDFFQERRLGELTREEVAELVEKRAAWDHAAEILTRPEEVRPRLMALYHLSGGNPRLVLALYGVLRAGVRREVYDQLLQLLDDVTAYYQARLNDCSPQGEHLLAEMAIAEGPLVPSELARRCHLKTNQVTAVLTQLEDSRFVRPGGRPTDKRARYWEVTDRLFRIWLQMREHGDTRGTLRWIVEFYQSWYAGHLDELLRDAGSQIRNAWANGAWDDLYRTLRHMEEAFPEVRGVVGLDHWDEDSADLSQEANLRLAWEARAGVDRMSLALPLGLCALKRGAGEQALDLLETALLAGQWGAMFPYAGAAVVTKAGTRAIDFLASLSVNDDIGRILVSSVSITLLVRLGNHFAAKRLAQQTADGPWHFCFAVANAGSPDEALPFRAVLGDRMPDELGPDWIFARFVVGEQVDTQVLQDWLEPRYTRMPVWIAFTKALEGAIQVSDTSAAQAEALLPKSATFHHALVRAARWVSARRLGHEMDSTAPYPLSPEEVAECWPKFPSATDFIDPLTKRQRLAFLNFYLALRDMGLLPPDLPVWSDAARVAQAPEREAALAGLHPELREAVLLLLTPPLGTESPSGT